MGFSNFKTKCLETIRDWYLVGFKLESYCLYHRQVCVLQHHSEVLKCLPALKGKHCGKCNGLLFLLPVKGAFKCHQTNKKWGKNLNLKKLSILISHVLCTCDVKRVFGIGYYFYVLKLKFITYWQVFQHWIKQIFLLQMPLQLESGIPEPGSGTWNLLEF